VSLGLRRPVIATAGIRRAAAAAALVVGVVTAVAGLPSPALAGDPWRYADRASWPEWAAVASDPHRLYPVFDTVKVIHLITKK